MSDGKDSSPYDLYSSEEHSSGSGYSSDRPPYGSGEPSTGSGYSEAPPTYHYGEPSYGSNYRNDSPSSPTRTSGGWSPARSGSGSGARPTQYMGTDSSSRAAYTTAEPTCAVTERNVEYKDRSTQIMGNPLSTATTEVASMHSMNSYHSASSDRAERRHTPTASSPADSPRAATPVEDYPRGADEPGESSQSQNPYLTRSSEKD